MADEKKLAGYICTGCGIGDRLDAVSSRPSANAKASCRGQAARDAVLRRGIQTIRDDIDNDGVTHVMIAACSRRAKVEAFNFPEMAMSRANLREGVIWLRPEGDEHQETTQEMADDYIRMACAELKFMNQPSSSEEQSLNRDTPRGGWRRDRHDGGPGGGQGRLSCAPRGQDRRARRSGRTVEARALERRSRRHGNNRNADLPQPEDTGVADLISW